MSFRTPIYNDSTFHIFGSELDYVLQFRSHLLYEGSQPGQSFWSRFGLLVHSPFCSSVCALRRFLPRVRLGYRGIDDADMVHLL